MCAEDVLVLFTRNFGFFWTVSLNIWALADHFSRVISKVHSRRGRQRPGFSLIPQNVSLESEHFLSRFVPENSGSFLKTAKYVRRRSIWYLFPEKMLFHFSTLGGNLSAFENNFPERSTQFFIFCVQSTFWYFLLET